MKTLITCNFIPESELSWKEVLDTLSSLDFNPQTGFGIRSVAKEDDIIWVRLIKVNYSYIFDYNDQTKEIEKKQISIVNEIDFLFAWREKLLSVFGPISNVPPVKLFIKNTFEGRLSVRPFLQTIPDICEKLLAKKISFNYLSVVIDNFRYLNGVVGRLSGTALNNWVVQDLIDSYKTDVQRIGIAIYLPDYSAPTEIVVSGMGLLKVSCDENDFNDIFDNLKTLLYT